MTATCSVDYDANIITVGADIRENGLFFSGIIENLLVFPYALSAAQIGNQYTEDARYTMQVKYFLFILI